MLRTITLFSFLNFRTCLDSLHCFGHFLFLLFTRRGYRSTCWIGNIGSCKRMFLLLFCRFKNLKIKIKTPSLNKKTRKSPGKSTLNFHLPSSSHLHYQIRHSNLGLKDIFDLFFVNQALNSPENKVTNCRLAKNSYPSSTT